MWTQDVTDVELYHQDHPRTTIRVDLMLKAVAAWPAL